MTTLDNINELNKNVLQKFSSRQAYTFIKGQYVPLVLQNISDESVVDLDKRKYYVQTYEFLMMGFLIIVLMIYNNSKKKDDEILQKFPKTVKDKVLGFLTVLILPMQTN